MFVGFLHVFEADLHGVNLKDEKANVSKKSQVVQIMIKSVTLLLWF